MAMFSPLDDYDRKTLVDMAVEADLAACKRLRQIVGANDRLDTPGMRGHRRQFGAEEFCKLFNLKLSKMVTIPMALLDETGPNMELYIDAPRPKARKKAVPFGAEQGYGNGGGPNPAGPRFQFRQYIPQAVPEDPMAYPDPEGQAADPFAAQPPPPQRPVRVRMERNGGLGMEVHLDQVQYFRQRGWEVVAPGEGRDDRLRDVPPAPPPEVLRAPRAQVINREQIAQERQWLNDFVRREQVRLNQQRMAAGQAVADAQLNDLWNRLIGNEPNAAPPPAERMQDVLDRQMQNIVDEDPF